MKYIIFGLVLSFCLRAAADENGSWFCEVEASKREGNTIWTCGKGSASDEGSARIKALNAAIREYQTICLNSSDCRNKRKTISPQRTSCTRDSLGEWTCNRMIVTTFEK